jgi:hypothetical protein
MTTENQTEAEGIPEILKIETCNELAINSPASPQNIEELREHRAVT